MTKWYFVRASYEADKTSNSKQKCGVIQLTLYCHPDEIINEVCIAAQDKSEISYQELKIDIENIVVL